MVDNTIQPVSGVVLQNLELRGPLGRLPLVTNELGQIQAAFDYAATWARLNNRPIYLGEFGAYEAGKQTDRARWARAVRTEAEKRGFAWAYWDFASGNPGALGFGIYNRETLQWKTPLLDALTR